MRITAIEATNWLVHRHIVQHLAPMTIIVGPNGAGKSSLADAVPFTLLGDLVRVSAKGERKRLLTEGAAKGSVRVSLGSGVIERDIGSGKLTQSAGFATEGVCVDALPYLADAQAFAASPTEQRRMLLQAVLQAEPTLVRVGEALEQRGVAADLLKELRKAHMGDVETWRGMARERASDARSRWKGLTNEAYGAVKAATWTAPAVQRPTDDEVAAAKTAAAQAAEAVRTLDRNIGAAAAGAAARQKRDAAIASLRTQTDPLPGLQDKIRRVIQGEQEVHDEHARSRDQLASLRARALPETDCPHCGGLVTIDAHGKLHQSSGTISRPTAATISSTTSLVAELADHLSKATAERIRMHGDIVRLQALRDTLTTLEQEAADDVGPSVAAGAVDAERHAQSAVQHTNSNLVALERQIAAAAEADAKTERAKRAHEQAEGWNKIAELLAPEGIPGDILAAAMAPLMNALRVVAVETAWPQVAIGPDMAITGGGRPYELLSESEQWRVDASLAVVLAKLSGLRLVVLDRFDVLDIPSRKPAMGWLYKRVQSGDLETCLLLGTLKEPPQAPTPVSVVWLGDVPTSQTRAA